MAENQDSADQPLEGDRILQVPHADKTTSRRDFLKAGVASLGSATLASFVGFGGKYLEGEVPAMHKEAMAELKKKLLDAGFAPILDNNNFNYVPWRRDTPLLLKFLMENENPLLRVVKAHDNS